MDYLLKLNEKQLEAVENTEGYLRVIAGAGSGKTKLLVSRYAYLVREYGIDTANILCVTFTNKAAGEMKRRIRALIGEEYDTTLICTYHGFCVRVLREDIEKMFYPKEFQIMDNTQQKSVLEEIYQKYELKLDHGSFEKTVKEIAEYKKSHPDYVGKMCCTDKCQILECVNDVDDNIVEDYLQHQKKIYAMDFNDLMYYTLYLFSRCPEVLEKWQDRLNYIQVDEFQDSSKTEMKLIDLISAKHKNLMIVGDPDQNIYEWRGSDVNLLVEFDKKHIVTKTIFLNQNYRSTPQILRCANELIEKNVFRLKKDLFTKGDSGADVYHYHTKDEYEEAQKIVETILKIRKKQGCVFADFAVLYRSGFLSRIIEKKFTEEGIPYEIYGGVKFYHRMEVQDIIAYLRLVAFDDDISFKRIINKPRRRFGRAKFQLLQSLQQEESLYKTLKDNIDNAVFKSSGARDFVNIIDSIRDMMNNSSISEIVEKICADSGYEKYIRELGDMERFDNLCEFKRIATEYEANLGEKITLKEFINHLSLQSDDESEENADTVKLMTIHAAKGLEFPNVFVMGLSEGIFPSAKTIEERKQLGLEEERRLCYVAITRAEKRLFLLDSEGYTQNSKQKLPSRFLAEIGENNYIRKGKISKELQEASRRFASELLSVAPAEVKRKCIGDKVYHPAFGEGEIVGFEKNNNSYRIRFKKLTSDRVVSSDFFSKGNHSPEIRRKSTDENDEISQKMTINKEELSENKQKGSLEGYKKVEEKRLSGPDLSTDKIPVAEQAKNLWNVEDVPKSGWKCVGITDLGAATGICEMCGHQVIRYVHHMVHPKFPELSVGCICAGKMEGDIEGAKRREADFKNRESRRENFKNSKWKKSKNGNYFLKAKQHLIVLYYNSKYKTWKYSLDSAFCAETYKTKNDAIDAAFEALDCLLKK